MNISSNTNQIADAQALNRIFYNYAVKSAQNFQKQTPEITNDSKENDIILIQNDVFKGIDVDDIKKSAQSIGEEITDEDIKYGLTYGRSVLADYSA